VETYNSNFARWLPWAAIVGIMSICASAGCAQDNRGQQKTFRVAPSFEEDRGDTSDRFIWRISGTAVFLSAGGQLSIRWGTGGEAQLSFLGANGRSEPRGEMPSESKTIYYLGPVEAWRSASHFERVRYSGIYPGIDLVFVATADQLEYNFEISPYANPRAIRIHYQGSSGHLTRGGDLEIRAGDATILQRRPMAFQPIRGRLRRIACNYRLKNPHEADFRLGAYNRGEPLFIDPVLNFSTYFGGDSFDSINAAATDAQGNLYVAGETSSGSLSNASIPFRSSREAFVAKFNSVGTLAFTLYLGGSNYDSGRGIAVDPLGNIYVTGVTDSSDFPITNGAFLTHAPGPQNAFVAKLSSGFRLQYSTYLGGGTGDFGMAIAVDSSGAAYVAGQTESTAFPVSSGAFQRSNQGGSDCFISKLNPAGSALAYSTYLGGSALDLCAGIAVDASGNTYVTGTTYSTNFPVAGSLQSSLLGTANAFVTKVNATGSALVYSTYLGGSVIDNATAIAVDSFGGAYLTGDTASFDFPTTPSVFQNGLNGRYNAFVSKLSAAGSTLMYSTLVGGSGTDVGTSIAIDAMGRAIIGGYTSSSNFPIAGAIQTAIQGAFDAFSTVLDPVGATLVFSSYFGGSGDDRGYAVALAPPSGLYLAGVTSSSNFPVAAPIQSGLSVAPDAFVLKLGYLQSIPAAVSATPSSGSGATQTFTLQYSDTTGAASLQTLYVYFTATFVNPAANSCLVWYNVAANQINLIQNGGTTWFTATPGTATTLQNSQCSLNVAATSVTTSGNTLMLNLPMTFLPAYAGAKDTYMYAADVSGANSGWQQLGTWTVPTAAGVPTAVSITPSSGSVASQMFALQFSDTAGAASLQTLYIYFTATFVNPAANSCLVWYNVPANQINLIQNGGTTWFTATPGSATTLQNSQCSLNVAATTVTMSGNTLTLNLAMTFLPAYAGAKNIYMYAADVSGANSGWQQLGTWTVPPAAGVPTAVSTTPSSGSLASQTFALQFSDTAGAASLQTLYVYFTATFVNPAANSCLVWYNATARQINLIQNGGTTWFTATPGTATTLQNNQCSLNVGATSVTMSGNTLTLNLAMTFLPAYAGAKDIYMYAADVSGSNSGWQQLGTWTVPPGAGVPTAVSTTPSSGSVASQTFALQFSDTAGAASLQTLYIYFTATFVNPAANSCLVWYNPAANQINLIQNGGTTWFTATPGTATTLQNSQCSLNVAATTVTMSGNTLTLNLAMTFLPAYAGAKDIYMYAADVSGANSGWQQLGTWTVPSNVGVPTAVSSTPSSGSVASQTFALQFSDTAGAASLQTLYVYFTATLVNPADNSCLVWYNPAANQINLIQNGGTTWFTATPGTATTLQNSQCSLNVAATTVTTSGNTLTLHLAMTFLPAYAGAKNIDMYAADVSGANSGWQQLGTWTVP